MQYDDLLKVYQDILITSEEQKNVLKRLIYSISCQECHRHGIKVWKNLEKKKWNLYCTDCIKQKYPFCSSKFSAAIPLKPGETKYFWITSDISDSWYILWCILYDDISQDN